MRSAVQGLEKELIKGEEELMPSEKHKIGLPAI